MDFKCDKWRECSGALLEDLTVELEINLFNSGYGMWIQRYQGAGSGHEHFDNVFWNLVCWLILNRRPWGGRKYGFISTLGIYENYSMLKTNIAIQKANEECILYLWNIFEISSKSDHYSTIWTIWSIKPIFVKYVIL